MTVESMTDTELETTLLKIQKEKTRRQEEKNKVNKNSPLAAKVRKDYKDVMAKLKKSVKVKESYTVQLKVSLESEYIENFDPFCYGDIIVADLFEDCCKLKVVGGDLTKKQKEALQTELDYFMEDGDIEVASLFLNTVGEREQLVDKLNDTLISLNELGLSEKDL